MYIVEDLKGINQRRIENKYSNLFWKIRLFNENEMRLSSLTAKSHFTNSIEASGYILPLTFHYNDIGTSIKSISAS